MNNIQQTVEDVAIMLSQFKLTYKKISLMKDTSIQFIIQDFGLIVCCIDRIDYAQVNNVVEDKYSDWRLIFISTSDEISEKRLEVLWALMRGGYMKWLRYTYPRQIRHVLLGHDNLGQLIIKERLRIWNDRPKFKYFIEDNKVALKNGVHIELTNDPSFFDYMPE